MRRGFLTRPQRRCASERALKVHGDDKRQPRDWSSDCMVCQKTYTLVGQVSYAIGSCSGSLSNEQKKCGIYIYIVSPSFDREMQRESNCIFGSVRCAWRTGSNQHATSKKRKSTFWIRIVYKIARFEINGVSQYMRRANANVAYKLIILHAKNSLQNSRTCQTSNQNIGKKKKKKKKKIPAVHAQVQRIIIAKSEA